MENRIINIVEDTLKMEITKKEELYQNVLDYIKNSEKFIIFTVGKNGEAHTGFHNINEYDFKKFKELVITNIEDSMKIVSNIDVANKIINNKEN